MLDCKRFFFFFLLTELVVGFGKLEQETIDSSKKEVDAFCINFFKVVWIEENNNE